MKTTSLLLHSRLGQRTISLIILAGVLPLILLALPIYHEGREMMTEEARIRLTGYSRLAARQIESVLESARLQLRAETPTKKTPFSRVIELDENLNPLSGEKLPWPALRSPQGEGGKTVPSTNAGEVRMTTPYPVGGAFTVALIAPRRDGKPGFIAGELDPIALWDVTRPTNFGRYDNIMVVEASGMVLAASSPNSEQQLGSVLPSNRRSWEISDGEYRAFYEITMPWNPDHRWGILAVRPITAANDLFAGLFRTLILYFLLAIAMLILLAIAFARSLTRPVTRLVKATQDLGTGNWSARAEVMRDDEIGELAKSFNETAQKLGELDAQARAYYESQIRLEGEASVGRLASTVAHEVNNPLASLRNWLGLIEDKLPDAERSIIAKLNDQIDRISRTVRALLDYSTYGSRRKNRLELDQILENVSTLFSGSFRRKGIGFHIQIEKNLPMISGDGDRIQQVLVNILENAREALQEGHNVHLTSAHESGIIRVIIEDDGPGLGPDPELLFKPFVTRKRSGTGLGLSIARQNCEAHGGTLNAENRTEGGARFIISLPAVEPSGNEARRMIEPVHVPSDEAEETTRV